MSAACGICHPHPHHIITGDIAIQLAPLHAAGCTCAWRCTDTASVRCVCTIRELSNLHQLLAVWPVDRATHIGTSLLYVGVSEATVALLCALPGRRAGEAFAVCSVWDTAASKARRCISLALSPGPRGMAPAVAGRRCGLAASERGSNPAALGRGPMLAGRTAATSWSHARQAALMARALAGRSARCIAPSASALLRCCARARSAALAATRWTADRSALLDRACCSSARSVRRAMLLRVAPSRANALRTVGDSCCCSCAMLVCSSPTSVRIAAAPGGSAIAACKVWISCRRGPSSCIAAHLTASATSDLHRAPRVSTCQNNQS